MKAQHPRHAINWFDGSQMGKLICSIDWTKKPLGPIETWPQPLRTAVSICLDSRHPIVLWWGPERTMFYNDAYRPMLGEDKHPQFMGNSGQACWAEIWDIIGPMMDQVINTGQATWSEDLFLLMFRSGYLEETYFTFSYSPIRDEEGQPCGIFNACSESTGRVLSERRLKMLRKMTKMAQTANDASRQCAEIFADNPCDIPFTLIYLLDEARKQLSLTGQAGLSAGGSASPLFVNLAQADNNGWPLARVITQGIPELVGDLTSRFEGLPTAPWDEPTNQAMLLPIMRPGQSQPTGVLVLGISPRRAFDDAYRGFFDLVADHVATAVANARAYEEEHRHAEALAEIDRAKTAFFSNISHEFRTPLTLMLGPLEALCAANLAEDERQHADLAYRNALRLLKLVNSLLNFSRIEANRAQIHFLPTDLATYTAELASVFRSAIEQAGLTLAVDCPPLPEPIFVDRDIWEKVILNLLSNAFKHTFVGSIRISLRWCGEQVECTVADTGVGIPAAALPMLFNRFSRIRGTQSRSHEGTGIGLALVKNLVEAHGGLVRVESQEGEGTTFTVSLPTGCTHVPAEKIGMEPIPSGTSVAAYVDEAMLWLANTSPPAAPQSSSTPTHPLSKAAMPTPNTRPRILLVDDNADMRAYIRQLLAAHYDIATEPDGKQAVANALAMPPDLILSDIMMPGMNGFDVLRALRADARTCTIPVILLSARAGEASVVEGLNAGADDYLAKPFSAGELLARVRANLASAKLRREWTQELEQQVHERTTALTQTTAALQAAKTAAERANAAKSRFLAAASHDLRQPLTALTLYTQMFKDKVTTSADRKMLANMQDCAASLGVLLSDLLDLSKLDTKVVKPTITPIPMAEMLASLVAIYAPKAQLKGLLLRSVTSRITAHTDPLLFKRILGNFLDNAIRYTKHGGILIGCRRRQGKFWVEVWDSGIGIAADKTTEIFEEFKQLDDDARTQGSGLGLAIVAKMAALLGLERCVRSRPGRGSVFGIELPQGEARLRPVPDVTSTSYRSLRIAFVDDNTMVREALTHALQGSGNQVVAAASGAALLSKLGMLPPDILVSDYRLAKGETGFDVITAVRATFGMTLPAIMITGDTDPALMRAMADQGINVLHKPIDLKILQTYLENITSTHPT